jgi:3-phenylpropionate/cinnamic acid dioxygenase small subunit
VDPSADINALLARYCWLVDHGEWEEWERCFAEDGAFVVRGEPYVGRKAISDYVKDELSRFRMIRHLSHLPWVELDDDERSAACRSYFELRAVTHRGRETVALGSYVDRVTLGPEGWQFAERRAEFDYWVPRQDRWYPEDASQAAG